MVRLYLFEAADDQHLVMQLAGRLGIEGIPSSRDPAVRTLGGNDGAKLAAAFKQEWDQLVLVLDADSPPAGGAGQTYARVRHAGATAGAGLPEQLPPEGLVHRCGDGRRVAVWLFPDNVRDGAMEEFALAHLVAVDDPLRAHANDQVALLLLHREREQKPAARFEPSRSPKAVLRTWLAWQERPGLPPGRAVAEGAFCSDEARFAVFAAWLRAACAP